MPPDKQDGIARENVQTERYGHEKDKVGEHGVLSSASGGLKDNTQEIT